MLHVVGVQLLASPSQLAKLTSDASWLGEASKRGAHRVRLQRIAQKVKKWGKPFGAYFNTLVSGCSDHDVEQVRKIAFGNSNGGNFTDDVSQIYIL